MPLALALPARAELPPGPSRDLPRADPGGDLSLQKLRSLLLDRLPGSTLKAPASPRYLALGEPHARGTRVLVGWVLPGLTAADLPDLRALTDALSAALRAPTPGAAVPFEATVSLDTAAEAPLMVVELFSSRPDASRALETTLLKLISRVGAAPPDGLDRVAALARAKLPPLSRGVVEVHRPGVPAATLPKLYVVEQGDSLAKVARRFRVSEQALIEANRLENRRLSKGQKLVLPR
jgi:hypothetical protein